MKKSIILRVTNFRKPSNFLNFSRLKRLYKEDMLWEDLL